MYLAVTYSLYFSLLLQDAVSSKPVSVENDWPEWSLPPPQKDGGGSCVSLLGD